ncbi:MAG: extracellular solute-binding protein [Candidatus Paceibacterota bacterium]|jgi:ABC-type glycerol-3-phosphate transport system substrate-binding protein
MKFNFQLILIIAFIVAAVFGVLVFSGAIPIGGGSEGSLGTVVLWGTVPTALMTQPLEEFNDANPTFVLKYEEKSADTFDQDLLEALASGVGPDLFFISDDLAYGYANKIIAIPYASYPVATFKNIFAGAGEVFLTSQGIMAFPLSIDPLLLYHNRSMLDAKGIVFPPKDWAEFSIDVAKLTDKDDANTISRSGVALGQYANVTHAKDILAMLFMQAGNPIVTEQGDRLKSTLDTPVGTYSLPSIVQFYTSFADPNSALYSWNRSFASSVDVFSREDLAFYFGYASELQSLVNKNPNQNFFIASVPQIKDAKTKLTLARVTGVAVSSASKNINTALTAASLLSSTDFAAKYAAMLGVAPARRDLLAVPPTEDSFSPIFYSSALYARSWLDPSPVDTDNIFRGMVNSVLSNNLTESDAVKDASSKLELLLLK